MASFDVVFEHNIKSEGGFASRQNDPGGYTYMGLSRQNHPNWAGWPLVADWVARSGGIAKAYKKIFPDPKLTQMVKDYYIKTYWNKLMLDKVQDQFTATSVYDFAMNSGQGQAVINKALGIPGSTINDKTVLALNADPVGSSNKIYKARKEYVLNLPARTSSGKIIANKKLVQTNPGLLTRIEKFANHPGAKKGGADQLRPAILDWMNKFYKVTGEAV